MIEQKLTGYPSVDKPWLKYYSEEAKSIQVPKCTAYHFLLTQSEGYMNRIAINYFESRVS